jgi:nicotinamidase-related amidase
LSATFFTGVEARMAVEKFMLDKEDAVLLIIDVQERLAPVIWEKERMLKNCGHLIELAKMITVPLIVTEQYPKGLGRTVPELQSILPEYKPVEKTAFNCCGEPAFLTQLRKIGRKKVLVAGMETHVCVLQTVTSLLNEGFIPHVVKDAVSSRTEANWSTGLEFLRDAGAVVSCTETVLFQLLKVAGTEEFKKISQRIK